MSNEVGVNIKIVDRLGVAQGNIPVILHDEAFGPVIRSGNSDMGGRVLFTGLTAGTYDIEAVGASGTSILRNYIVKNAYSIVPGSTEFNFENRYSVRSGDGVPSPGILTQNKEMRQGVFFGGQLQPTTIYGGNNISPTPMTGTAILLGKQSGNSYYHLNQDVGIFQRTQIQIG